MGTIRFAQLASTAWIASNNLPPTAAELAITVLISSNEPFAIRGVAGPEVARVIRVGRPAIASIFLASVQTVAIAALHFAVIIAAAVAATVAAAVAAAITAVAAVAISTVVAVATVPIASVGDCSRIVTRLHEHPAALSLRALSFPTLPLVGALIAALIATFSLLSTLSPVSVAIPASIPALIAVSVLSLYACPGDRPGAEQDDESEGRSRNYFPKAIESHTQITFHFGNYPSCRIPRLL